MSNSSNMAEAWGERLTSHMKALCKNIGARPPTSAQERQDAEYVKKTFKQLGYQDIQEQIFHSARAVAVLRTMAETLRTQPLRSTEATFLFTGCEEVMCVGME